ncbi:MAG: nucleotidyltransferase family protein [Flavobacteriaceae bacterium]|uniref:nucleotidyltransferase family protein n=1 Tax=Flagellimonas sp. SN16 TaxID=3415142 RepID=UPI003C56C1FE|nr:nucleotidyltransferase family protein [Flavobacteriaceae bacterium]
MAKISILILAAGASSRMKGKAKQLLPWKDTTLLGHAIVQAKKVSDSVTVVYGANSEQIKSAIPNTVESIQNSDWELGMGSSISKGVQHILKENPSPDGILITLVDQPLLDAPYLNQLKSGFEKDLSKITATAYGEKVGAPAIFPKHLFLELTQLSGDFGARQIINAHKKQISVLQPEGKEIDIDTIETYNQLTKTTP